MLSKLANELASPVPADALREESLGYKLDPFGELARRGYQYYDMSLSYQIRA